VPINVGVTDVMILQQMLSVVPIRYSGLHHVVEYFCDICSVTMRKYDYRGSPGYFSGGLTAPGVEIRVIGCNLAF
jgi:hypothetical protein